MTLRYNDINFDPRWITQGADEGMIKFADGAGENLKNKKLTTSQIRNIYGEIKRIQSIGFEKDRSSFYLLKPKVAYTYGRTLKQSRGNLIGNDGLRIFKVIFDEAAGLVTDEKTYNNFCNLMEAILAYHKFYGGKD